MKREKSSIRCIHFLISFLMLGIFLLFTNKMNVCAKENDFDIQADFLSTNDETYDIRINITNKGDDWEGTVRVMYVESYYTPAAYDTIISLPEASTKQFDVKISMSSIEELNGSLKIILYDEKMKECAKEEIPRFFFRGEESLSMGILSDDYDSLTCMDFGGKSFFYYGAEYPIRLHELSRDNILEHLDGLEFLIIDTYDTSVLTQDVLDAIEMWNSKGGVLIIGTGVYADKTLALFQDSYMEIEVKEIYEPGKAPYYDAVDFADWSQLYRVEFLSASDYYEQYPFALLSRPYDDGAIGILPFALSEVVKMDQSFFRSTDKKGFLLHMLETISSDSNQRYNDIYGNNRYRSHQIDRMLRMISKINNKLNFDVLKVIVIIYVVFVGPVLYLILRALKKREWYWVAVPATTVLGVIIIFFAGRGFEVYGTQVYSVTVQDMSGERSEKSYLYCFDAGKKEWGLKLNDEYDYITPFNSYSYIHTENEYFYHFIKEGDNYTIGMNPSTNFDDMFLVLHKPYGSDREGGTIGVDIDRKAISSKMQGEISNETEMDFKYFAVLMKDSLFVYEGLNAGETCDLSTQNCLFGSYQFDLWHDYMHEVHNMRENESTETISALSALGIGMANIYYIEEEILNSISDEIVVIGVVDNWKNIIDDECTEYSYGCLYVVE